MRFGAAVEGCASTGARGESARLLYRMARDGQLPHLLAHVHPVRKVPAIGLAIVVYVLVNAHAKARIAGTLGMVAGLALFFGLRLAGRSTALPAEEPRAER